MRVYIIFLKSREEFFVKIGIAKNLSDRFRYFKKAGYKVIIKKVYRCQSIKDARSIELQLHYRNKFYRYIPAVRFSGYTECFTNVVV